MPLVITLFLSGFVIVKQTEIFSILFVFLIILFDFFFKLFDVNVSDATHTMFIYIGKLYG